MLSAVILETYIREQFNDAVLRTLIVLCVCQDMSSLFLNISSFTSKNEILASSYQKVNDLWYETPNGNECL